MPASSHVRHVLRLYVTLLVIVTQLLLAAADGALTSVVILPGARRSSGATRPSQQPTLTPPR
jgi:hypothetical protein